MSESTIGGILKKNLFLIILSAAIFGCSAESPKLEYKVFKEKVLSKNDSIEFNTKVDILFVVDDSGSMGSYQANLAGNVSIFLDAISRNRIVDYHIGVINSSMSPGGKLVQKQSAPAIIENSTEYGLYILKNYLRVGTNGAGNEKFFQPITAALSEPLISQDNKGFLRDDATLAVIYITDAEDQSNFPNTSSKYLPKDFHKFLLGLKKGVARKAIVYGLLIPSSQVITSDCTRDDYGVPPDKLEETIKLTNGRVYNLCDSNYSANLGALGRDIVSRVSMVRLEKKPDPTTIIVKYGNNIVKNDITKGWTYNPADNTIVFGEDLIKELNGTSENLIISFTAAPSDLK